MYYVIDICDICDMYIYICISIIMVCPPLSTHFSYDSPPFPTRLAGRRRSPSTRAASSGPGGSLHRRRRR